MYFYFHLFFVDIAIYLTFISCLIGANDIVIQVLKHFFKLKKRDVFAVIAPSSMLARKTISEPKLALQWKNK